MTKDTIWHQQLDRALVSAADETLCLGTQVSLHKNPWVSMGNLTKVQGHGRIADYHSTKASPNTDVSSSSHLQQSIRPF